MPWGRLDDTLYDHHKVEALPSAIRLACVGLQALAISWCNRQLTDGFVPESRVAKLGGTKRHRDALIDAHIWEEAVDGVQIHDFLHYNKSKTQVEAERAAARGRMQHRRQRSSEVQTNTTPNNDGSSDEVQANTERSSREVRDSRARSRAYPGPARPNPDSPPTPSQARGRRRGRSNGLSHGPGYYDSVVIRDADLDESEQPPKPPADLEFVS